MKQVAEWQNWSGSVNCNPTKIVYPATQAEIIQIVKDCRKRNIGLRVIGSGHSFSPLVKTDGIIMSLDHYSGVIKIDHAKQQATVLAGTKIKTLGEELFKCGLAQPNLGDIDVQSIAGAISTGTHGTGVTLGNISSQVVALTLVTADGEVIECSEAENPEIFKAAQVSIGVLGIITKITLQCVPAYKLQYFWKKKKLSDCLAKLEQYKSENRNFEFLWLPHTDWVQAKFINLTDQPPKRQNLFKKFNDLVLENGGFWLLSEFARRFPAKAPGVSKLAADLLSEGSDVNYSHRIYATPRLVKFQEMEYNLPAENFVPAMQEIEASIKRHNFQVHFPLECRFVKSDAIYLSPAYGRESAYIAVHMYKGMEYQAYFEAIETIFKKYNGRPHWGKLHTRTAAELRELYPAWDKFQAVRQQLDPTNFFLNDYLQNLLVEKVRPKLTISRR
jgi:FAD-linked oxidoreductase